MKLVKPIELFQKLKASPGLLLGLDMGTKYVGFAVSDADNKVALPKSLLVRTKSNIKFMAEDFQLLAVQVRLFIEDLRRTGKLEGISYTYWSESYSSLCVEAFLESIKLPPLTYKTVVDKFAAVGILQMAPMTRGRRLREAQMAAEEVVVPPAAEEVVVPPAAEEVVLPPAAEEIVVPKAEMKVMEELPPTIKKKMIPKAEIAVKEEVAPDDSYTRSSSHPSPLDIDLAGVDPDYVQWLREFYLPQHRRW